ncbi:MAG: hypothetical protein ACREAR_08035 [Nitrosotalea sp.]
MEGKEPPYKDIEDFIKNVYIDEILKIKPEASERELTEELIGPQKSYIIANLLDLYVTRFRNWKPKTVSELYREDLSSKISLGLSRDPYLRTRPPPKINPNENPYAHGMRIIIQALKSRGLTEGSDGLTRRYRILADELSQKTLKLEELSEGYEKLDEKLKEKNIELENCQKDLDKIRGVSV